MESVLPVFHAAMSSVALNSAVAQASTSPNNDKHYDIGISRGKTRKAKCIRPQVAEAFNTVFSVIRMFCIFFNKT